MYARVCSFHQADKANVCRLIPLLKKIKSLEAQTAAVLLEVRPYVTPTLADKVHAHTQTHDSPSTCEC